MKELIQVYWTLSDEKTKKRETSALLKGTKLMLCRELTIITFNEDFEIDAQDHKIVVKPFWKWSLDK